MDPHNAERLVNGLESTIKQAKGFDRRQAETAARELIEQVTAAVARGEDIATSTPPTKANKRTSFSLTRLVIQPDGTVRAASHL